MMTIFQQAGIALVVVLGAASAWSFLRRRVASSLLWLLLWCAAGVAIARPELTARVAELLGIGRGADLVFYCGILGMLVGFFLLFARLRRVDRSLTLLTRELALLRERPRRGDSGGEAPGPERPA